MYDSYFDTTPYHLKPYKSFSYYFIDSTASYKPFPQDANHGGTTSNGGLKTSIDDMIKFSRFLIGTTDPNVPYGIILERNSLLEMFKIQAKIDASGNHFVCLSFFKDHFGKYSLLYHGGTANGFISLLGYNQETETVFFAVINTPVIDRQRFRQEIKEYMMSNIIPRLDNSIR
jgi:hypothetical protein